MYDINFCRAPSGKWVGVCIYNGGHVFSTGRVMDDLVKHAKINMWTQHNISQRQVYLATKQTPTEEFEKLYAKFMTPIFYGRYWRDKNKPIYKEPTADPTLALNPRPNSYTSKEYITEEKDGELVVYELREVARYRMHGSKTDKPVDSQAVDIPVCQDETESQEQNL